MRIPPSLLTVVAIGLFAVLQPRVSLAAVATAPAISSVRGKVVFVKVPPGFQSVTLHQRTGLKSKPTKALATREPDLAGGTIGFVLKSAVAPRALFVTSVRAVAATSSAGAGTSLFPADPALGISDGFVGVGGSMSGVLTMASAVRGVTFDSSSATTTAPRDVVESDIWRVAGDRLYFFNELRGLQVFDVSNPDDPALLGQLREPNHGEQMYLLDSNHVALLTRPSSYFTLSSSSINFLSPSIESGSGAVVIVDVSTGRPAEIARVAYSGYLVESRLVGTALYLVSDVSDGTQSGLRVTSFGLSDPAHPEPIAMLPLGSYGGVVSATDRFLFVVRYAQNWTRSTIDVIDISAPNGALKRRGKIEVAGVVGDKFKLHLEGDILTVVSAVPRDWSGDQSNPANASRTVVETFSLARPATPVRLGSLSVGVGENVRATRFADGRLYVVTFFTIDPLWVIDLADPKTPTLLGELEVPGFSNYIEPLGDRLVAIGRVGGQTAVSLFDVSNPAQPLQLSQIPLGDGYSYSEANWDEKAFSVLPEQNLILVPYSGFDRNSGWANRVQLIDLTRTALTPRGIIDHPLAARRTTVVNDRILAISSSHLVTVNYADRDQPQVTSDVEIAWRVDRVFLAGNHLVQVGGSAAWNSGEPPTITVSTAADPETALNVFDLENVPVVGATVRGQRLYVAQQVAGGWGPIFYLQSTAGSPVAPTSSLIVSVFDLSKLPAIERLGRTEASVQPSYGYGTAQLEAAWPDDGTLVWVRPQWMSWWWRSPMPIAIATGTTATVASSGASVVQTNAGTQVLSNNDPRVPTANSIVANSALRWIAPWTRVSNGHEMLVFDVRAAAAPKFTAALNVRQGQSGDWSAPIALGGKLYLSYVAHDEPAPSEAEALPRKFRHFMRQVDFADVTAPVLGPEVNIPGRLLAVTRGGATLLTVGCGFDADGQPNGKRVFHTSSYDGVAARLVDQLATPAAYDPYALDGATLVLGSWPLGSGQVGQLQTWRIGDDEKFALAAQIAAPAFTNLGAVGGLLVGFDGGLPHLYDVSDPASPVDLAGADTREVTIGVLETAAGGAGQGLWFPLGAYGVGIVPLPK
jgi:hypothetical protein